MTRGSAHSAANSRHVPATVDHILLRSFYGAYVMLETTEGGIYPLPDHQAVPLAVAPRSLDDKTDQHTRIARPSVSETDSGSLN